MLELINSTLAQIYAAYLQYAGVGMYMLLFFTSLIYTYIKEVKNNIKLILCYYPLIALFVIWNPLIVYKIIAVVGKEVYWRIFWILPTAVAIAYVATVTVCSVSRKYQKVIVTIALTSILIMGGQFIFVSENYSRSSNWYKLPEQTIEVCNILENDCSGTIRVVVPDSLVVSLRQYDANIQMVYGRDGTNNSGVWNEEAHILYDLMLLNELDIKSISGYMNDFQCNYIVLNKSTILSDDLENYGYHFVTSTEQYNIYRFNYQEKDP